MPSKPPKETPTKENAPEYDPLPMTPGWLYVAGYIGDMEGDEGEQVAECIDAKRVLICPNCHFLYIPPPGDGACDVCAAKSGVADGLLWRGMNFNALCFPDHNLTGLRRRRAHALCVYWYSAYAGAEGLAFAAMRDGLKAAGFLPVPENPPPAKE